MKKRFIAINHSSRRLATIIMIIILALIIVIISLKWIFSMIVNSVSSEQINLFNMGIVNVKLMDLNLLSPDEILTVSLNLKKDDSKKLEIISDINKENGPLVYIYNTHDLERYSSTSVSYASNLLSKELMKYQIPALVEEKSTSEYLKQNDMKTSNEFVISRTFIDDAMRKNETLRYFIDIHRSNASSEVTTIEIDGIKYAKLLFVVSMDGDFYDRMLEFAETLNSMFDKRLSRGNTATNNFYNQDMDALCLTLEIGGYESTLEEVSNTIKVFAGVLYEYMSEGYDGK